MAKEFDYKTALVKLVGKDQEFVFGAEHPIKVNNDVITRISTWNGGLDIYNGSLLYGEDKQESEMLSSIFCIVKQKREEATKELLDINKELQRIAGYDVNYYKPENWRKSFNTYSLNRLYETLEDYRKQLKFKQQK